MGKLSLLLQRSEADCPYYSRRRETPRFQIEVDENPQVPGMTAVNQETFLCSKFLFYL